MSESGGFHQTVKKKKTIKNPFEPQGNEVSLLSGYLGHGGKKAIKHAAEIAYSTIDIMTARQASLLLQSVRVSVLVLPRPGTKHY
jgi:hypothetical protein